MPNPFPRSNGTPWAADAELSATDDLGVLLTDPGRVARVPVHQLPALLTQLASVQTRLAAVEGAVAARLLDAGTPEAQPDRLLTADEAAARLGVTKDWLRRRSTLPFVVKLSEGVVRYSAAGIARYIAQALPRLTF
jgi:hypothetical protein